MTKEIFKTEAPTFWDNNLTVSPILPGTKAGPANWNNLIDQVPSIKNKESLIREYSNCGIGLLTGKKVSDTHIIIAIDIDNDLYVGPITKMMGGIISGKRGEKGLTIFVLGNLKQRKMAIPTKGARIVDILSRSICVVPPSIHPKTNNPYVWIGQPLPFCDLRTLPILTEEKALLIKAILENENHVSLLMGEATHDPALSLIASLAGKFNDKELVCGCLLALLPDLYSGNLRNEISEMWDSAKSKGLGKPSDQEIIYDPSLGGPKPMGYTDNGQYVFQHPEKKILASLSPAILMSEPGLCDLAPMDFWKKLCPRFSANGLVLGLDSKRIGDMLMQKCREVGPFIASKVRGCGIWREGPNIIQNLRGEIPTSDSNTYIRFESLPTFKTETTVSAKEILEGFSLLNWAYPSYAMLLLGWATIAPICGALKWRPHIFINGPKNTGKSTIIRGLVDLLTPMVISVDGTSSEAGIRQLIGPDSRPVILDEFESDRNIGRMKSVLKLARSASSAQGPIARGTPEGKALQFQLHTTFCFGAIIPIPGTSADASRIVELELNQHNNDQVAKSKIDEFLSYLSITSGAWPHQMINIVDIVVESINLFEKAMPAGDLRNNINIATLLGAAFVSLNERIPTKEEALKWINDHSSIIVHLAQAHEEDDSQDCLNHLLYSKWKDAPIGDLIMRSSDKIAFMNSTYEDERPEKTLASIGINVTDDGILVANKHPELNKIYANTIWADGAWKVALRRLLGAANTDKTRSRFSGGHQVRCTFIPNNIIGRNPDAPNVIHEPKIKM